MNPELRSYSQLPPFLNQGDKVAIVSIAKKISPEEIEFGIEVLKSWSLEVVVGETIGAEENQFAGSDEFRAAEFQKMLDDDQIKAIIFARGGYGTLRVIDKIDFSRFKKNPKWLVGFSDLTVLHSHVYSQFGICSLHAPMPFTFPTSSEDSIDWTRRILFGEKPEYSFQSHYLNRNGNAKGILVGGNLSLLCAINNSVSDFDASGKILFIEDVDEYLYHIDRMLLNLKRCGKLKNLTGLLVGAFNDLIDNQIPFGKTAEEIILDTVHEYGYPVCFDFPAGHIENNLPLIIGGEYELTADKENCLLKFY